MIGGFALLLAFQLAGEAIVLSTGIPVSGPVVGMFLLFAALVARGRAPRGLQAASSTLLGNLPLLFVPAATGALLHLDLLAGAWLPLLAAVLGSTFLAMAVSGGLLVLLDRAARRRERR